MTLAEARKAVTAAKKALRKAESKYATSFRRHQKAAQTAAGWQYEVNHWHAESKQQTRKVEAAERALEHVRKTKSKRRV